jgi:hypothetical protein
MDPDPYRLQSKVELNYFLKTNSNMKNIENYAADQEDKTI